MNLPLQNSSRVLQCLHVQPSTSFNFKPPNMFIPSTIMPQSTYARPPLEQALQLPSVQVGKWLQVCWMIVSL
jgi:hypothetical protein